MTIPVAFGLVEADAVPLAESPRLYEGRIRLDPIVVVDLPAVKVNQHSALQDIFHRGHTNEGSVLPVKMKMYLMDWSRSWSLRRHHTVGFGLIKREIQMFTVAFIDHESHSKHLNFAFHGSFEQSPPCTM